MDKVRHPTAPDGIFIEGNPLTGPVPTRITAEFLNEVQDELVNAIRAGGITPSHDAHNQLALAIQRMVDGAVERLAQQLRSEFAGGGGAGGITCVQLRDILQHATVENGVLVLNCDTGGGGTDPQPLPNGSYASTDPATSTLTLKIAGTATIENGVVALADPVDGSETYTIAGNSLTITEI